MNKFSKNALIATIAITASNISNAGLYLSPDDSAPVLRQITNNVNVDNDQTKVSKKASYTEATASVTAGSAFGKNIPIEIALENIGIDQSYRIKYDEYVKGQKVSWDSGIEWKDVLNDISSDNELSIVINEKDKIIAVGDNQHVAIALSNIEPNSWPLIEGRSLRRNLELWSERAGWDLVWESRYDYPINHNADIKGDLPEALATVLEAISENGKPLSATFHKGNKVIQIIDGGFEAGE